MMTLQQPEDLPSPEQAEQHVCTKGQKLQALRRSGVRDPVLLLDEVDKMGHDSLRGDPASALLEVLDPNQNQAFVDTYLNVPFDLSQVLHALSLAHAAP